jgi:hypothetical protein
MMAYPVFSLTLHKSYYEKGFFNVTKDFERYVVSSDSSITLFLGSMNKSIPASMTRKANINGSPRIHGRSALRDWFFQNFSVMQVVDVRFLSPIEIMISAQKGQLP